MAQEEPKISTLGFKGFLATKRCNGCKEILATSSFSRIKDRSPFTVSGYYSLCKPCATEKSKKGYVRKPRLAKFRGPKRKPGRPKNPLVYIDSRTCKECGLLKPISEFNRVYAYGRIEGTTAGHRTKCRDCTTALSSAYHARKRKEDPEYVEENKRRCNVWYYENIIEVTIKSRIRNKIDPAARTRGFAALKAFVDKMTPEERKEHSRQSANRHRRRHPELVKLRKNIRRCKNPERKAQLQRRLDCLEVSRNYVLKQLLTQSPGTSVTDFTDEQIMQKEMVIRFERELRKVVKCPTYKIPTKNLLPRLLPNQWLKPSKGKGQSSTTA